MLERSDLLQNTEIAYGLFEHLDPATRRLDGVERNRGGAANLFLSPDVPGFWPSKGVVGISLT